MRRSICVLSGLLSVVFLSVLDSGCSDSSGSAERNSATSSSQTDSLSTPAPESRQDPKPPAQNNLEQAIIDTDGAGVKQALKAGADANALGPDGEPPLFMAAYRGDKNIVKLLLKAGAKINGRSADDAMTVLDYAISQGHTKLASYLRSKGAKATGEGKRVLRQWPVTNNDHWDHPSG